MANVVQFFIGHPLRILVIAVAFFAMAAARHATAAGGPPRSRALIVAGVLWLLAAAWECAVVVFTPEANIRADLLLWLPVLSIASAWALLRGWR